MSRMSRSLRRPALWLLLAALVLMLAACGGQITNTNWAGLSTDGERVYLAYGPRVLAYDPATQERSWIFPEENGAVQFYSAPSVEGDRVVFGDYGRAGGFFSPRVTVSIYGLNNVASGAPGALWTNSESASDKIVAPPPVSYTHLDVYKRQVGATLAHVLLAAKADHPVTAIAAADVYFGFIVKHSSLFFDAHLSPGLS